MIICKLIFKIRECFLICYGNEKQEFERRKGVAKAKQEKEEVCCNGFSCQLEKVMVGQIE